MSEVPEIIWSDGYPTDKSLRAFAGCEVDWAVAPLVLRQELSKCAENCCASYDEKRGLTILKEPCTKVYFSTGGWSGAENLIGVLLSKFTIKYLQEQWRRGGHYIFEIRDEEPDSSTAAHQSDPKAVP